MSKDNVTCKGENEEALRIIKETIKFMVGKGIIHSRDDIIRHLCGGKFDITEVTENSITICPPGEPENTEVLSGWLFSERFRLGRDRHLPGDVLQNPGGEELSTQSRSVK